jgi:hypothetical protein
VRLLNDDEEVAGAVCIGEFAVPFVTLYQSAISSLYLSSQSIVSQSMPMTTTAQTQTKLIATTTLRL